MREEKINIQVGFNFREKGKMRMGLKVDVTKFSDEKEKGLNAIR